MKVCLISSYPPKASGIGTYTIYFQETLSRLAHVDVLSWNYDSWLSKLLSPLTNLGALRKAVKDYDIVHVQYHLGDVLFLFLPVLCVLERKARIVLTLHEDYLNLPLSFIITWYHSLFYRCADLLILHTSEQLKVLTAGLKKRSVVIPHGVIKREPRRRPRKHQILLPGFVNPWKGHDVAVHALSLILKKVPDARLMIAGKAHDEAYAENVRGLISGLGLKRHVTFKDRYIEQKELFSSLRTADIALLPYRRITMSGILCHIISWNVPCVMSDLAVLKEFTKNKAVYFKQDSARDLANKAVRLLKDRRRKKRMQDDFQRLARQYSWQETARVTYQHYKGL
jgi:glycosyltransferase involved in cell wall biosynthesis